MGRKSYKERQFIFLCQNDASCLNSGRHSRKKRSESLQTFVRCPLPELASCYLQSPPEEGEDTWYPTARGEIAQSQRC